jgi:uncharacterized membrane protein YsdA (DUF1294 family)
MGTAVFVVVYLLGLNVLAFWAFLTDKRAAIAGTRRISEDRLLAIAFLGGAAGAKLAQRLLRHKIRTEPFRTQLDGIIAVQTLALAALWVISLLSQG